MVICSSLSAANCSGYQMWSEGNVNTTYESSGSAETYTKTITVTAAYASLYACAEFAICTKNTDENICEQVLNCHPYVGLWYNTHSCDEDD
jgi:hypothetical protein